MISRVSVVIPTKNSSKTIEQCLKSVKSQSYPNIEIIIADSASHDDTVEIAKQVGCKIINTNWKLLGARYQGFKASSGEYVLILDSDQILEPNAVERSLNLFDKMDMLCLEEMPYRVRTILEKMFEADRKLIHDDVELQIDPVLGTLLPRFFKRELLESAFQSIPSSHFPEIIALDHAIIYLEAYKISTKVGVVPHAVWHNESSNLKDLWRKNFRYGRSIKILYQLGYYNDFCKKKTRLRQTKRKISRNKFLSSVLLFLKAPPYFLGLYF